MARDNNNSLKDAFLKTANGKNLIIKVETNNSLIRKRIRTLKDVAYQMLVKCGHRFDLYNQAKPNIKILGINGGKSYEKALNTLKLIFVTNKFVSPNQSWNMALKSLNI